MTTKFSGWNITAAAFCTFGVEIAFFYYATPFFYDYYQQAIEGSTRSDIVLGYPLGALLTLWVGPLLVHRFSPRRMILIGTGLICLCYVAFGTIAHSLTAYYAIWFFFVVGYIFSGPIPHQVLISQWFRKRRGMAMGIAYVGVGVFSGITIPYIVNPLNSAIGDFRSVLIFMGPMVLVTWPIVLFLIKDKPADVGQYPDGDPASEAITKIQPEPFGRIVTKRSFWLLVVGSFCSIGAIGAIFSNMKFILEDQGFVDQAARDAAHGQMTQFILFASIGGRLFIGWLADKLPKKYVMAVTYFLVAFSIPLLLMVTPDSYHYLYLFSVVFGFGMGADYMLIPLMAAEQFGVNSLSRTMGIILPADTIGQTWVPYFISRLQESLGGKGYGAPLMVVFGIAMAGALAVSALPRRGREDEAFEPAAGKAPE